MILLDTSGLLSALDASQTFLAPCVAAMRRARAPFLLSPFVLAEIDYLVGTRIGVDEELALLEQVAVEAYQLEPFSAADVAAARLVVERYRELNIGLADASLVVLSERHRVRDVLTLDIRHFRAMRAFGRRQFRIRPADG
jgi:predicted nucleic acid-binding protein